MGIQPDILVCRSDRPIPESIRQKIALFCNVSQDNVIENLNTRSLYEVPLLLERNGLCDAVCRRLCLPLSKPDLAGWEAMVARELNPKGRCEIAIVGKYVTLRDAYLSVVESLRHGGITENVRVDIRWVDAEDIERDGVPAHLDGVHGILVPGGFGERGLLGKVNAIRYARERGIPFFGICLGMQMAVIEFARNVLGLAGAHTTEVDPAAPYPVVDLMPDQRNNLDESGNLRLGGTLRLGGYDCKLTPGTLARALYGRDMIRERHRHRYEINNAFVSELERRGLRFSGWNPERGLAEIMELDGHSFFIGVQFHPELKSRPDSPHPVFAGFIRAAKKLAES